VRVKHAQNSPVISLIFKHVNRSLTPFSKRPETPQQVRDLHAAAQAFTATRPFTLR
jgi:hypothetical protein